MMSINSEEEEDQPAAARITTVSPRGDDGDSKSWETWVDSDYVATAEQLNSTPFQYVFPSLFSCLHSCGCCRSRDLNQKVGKTSIQRKFERFLDKYLQENQIYCEETKDVEGSFSEFAVNGEIKEPSDPLATMGLGYKQYFKANAFLLFMFAVMSILAAGMVACYIVSARTNLHVMPSPLVGQSIGNTAQA